MRHSTSLDDFIAMTQRIIAKDGFGGYLPTLVLPARRHVAVLEGVPTNVNVEVAAQRWAEDKAGSDDFQLAYKINSGHFKVVERIACNIEERVVAVGAA